MPAFNAGGLTTNAGLNTTFSLPTPKAVTHHTGLAAVFRCQTKGEPAAQIVIGLLASPRGLAYSLSPPSTF